jgi:hypothetical protein
MPNEIYIFFPQNKLQEDFDMVQAMLEEKEKEIDMLTQELRILCHQEYQEYYVISNIWNKCQQETGILCYQEHQEYIMSSGISRIFMSSFLIFMMA